MVGNIPYNITAPVIFKLLERPRPSEILLMVQKEVAERLVADPGTSEYGALTVGVGTVARCKKLFAVPRTAFRQVPKGDSVVIRIVPADPPPRSPDAAAGGEAGGEAAAAEEGDVEKVGRPVRQSPADGWIVTAWQDIYSKTKGDDGLTFEIDEAELTLTYVVGAGGPAKAVFGHHQFRITT